MAPNKNENAESKNKGLVLEAFDTLFNKRDYVSAESYWLPNYVQHSAHIGPGHDGLFNLINELPPTHWDVIQDEATKEQSKSGKPMFGETSPGKAYNVSSIL